MLRRMLHSCVLSPPPKQGEGAGGEGAPATSHHALSPTRPPPAPTPLPAMSGPDRGTGSYSPNEPPPSEALGSTPSEPQITEASSLRMSPNIFSVTSTSKLAGAVIKRGAA